ncbi:hypothetical protein [Commensalibacter communis]|uniref:hypothetical protein n=1 Tax=Commensalibacter communis TaxID=2972786 RepID=UPI00232B5B24|nr:hypothetical protein [Commensalibacter communis]
MVIKIHLSYYDGGQILYSLNDSKAIEFLMRAYMLEGGVFSLMGKTYLFILRATNTM